VLEEPTRNEVVVTRRLFNRGDDRATAVAAGDPTRPRRGGFTRDDVAQPRDRGGWIPRVVSQLWIQADDVAEGIPEPLLEAELFGYTKGAFTGAVQSRIGRIHAAQGGTLFLDEIGELPLGLQSKLLRFLEQGEVQRLGSSDSFRVDVRVVAATNSNLRKLVEEQRFREDLYYRLAIFPIELPLLKDRMEDLPSLASTFLAKFSAHRMSLSSEASFMLLQHHWPGNVRELRNVIERATILAQDDRQVLGKHISL